MIHLYCLAVQAGFYSDLVECSPQDHKVPGSILGRDMEIFLRVRDKWRPTLGAICHGLLKNSHAPAEDRTGDPSIYS